MCDTYGAPGSKTVIDIEELDKKGFEMISKEFPKPSNEDIQKLAPLIKEILEQPVVLGDRELTALKRKHKFNGKRSFLFQVYLVLIESNGLEGISDEQDEILRKSLQIKAVKSWSGICNITIFTSPYPEYTNLSGEKVKQPFSCAYNCSYCPSQEGMPRSYLKLEPATLRAAKNSFDCVAQMHDRMSTLYLTGHGTLTKLEVNILGGTFTSYPNEYREEFVRDIYYAANTFWDSHKRSAFQPRGRLCLNEEKILNETAKCKVVQVVCELRPDSITPAELRFLRYLSITRIQMGIQHIDDHILKKINRQCPTAKTIKAIEDAKRIGMKIDGHFMPNLPFSSPEKDRKMLLDHLVGLKGIVRREIRNVRTWKEWICGKAAKEEHWEFYNLADENIQIDQMKIYPTAVTIHTEIEKWYKEGSYIPYDESHLVDMLLEFKAMVFPWIRLNRIMRDFFADNIYSKSGSNLNLRNDLKYTLKKEGKSCACIRCREAKLNKIDDGYIIVIRQYNASNGLELFISAESKDNNVLYGFVRLRLDDAKNKLFPELNNAALLREAHVYSTVTELGKKGNCQHQGIGTLLMKKAEEIAFGRGYYKMAVIAAVGSRGFYKKIGYELDQGEGEYMIKILKDQTS